MPDDMLEDAIAVSKAALDEHYNDFDNKDEGGTKVSNRQMFYNSTIDRIKGQRTYGCKMGAIMARISR